MEVKIYANETTTVLEALYAYKESLGSDIYATESGKENWRSEAIVERMKQQQETLSRVIARIEEL